MFRKSLHMIFNIYSFDVHGGNCVVVVWYMHTLNKKVKEEAHDLAIIKNGVE